MQRTMNSIRFNGQYLFPSKVVCAGRNYLEHIAELRNEKPEQLVLFVKPNSAITDQLRLHKHDEIHFEAEICFLMQDGRYAGVGFGLDLTKRGLQSQLKSRGLPWERAKAFDGAALFSEFVSIAGDIDQLRLELWIDGELRQHGQVEQMLFKPAQILDEIKSFMSLENADIVMTGTPAGVAAIRPGQNFHGKILLDQQILVEQRWTVADWTCEPI